MCGRSGKDFFVIAIKGSELLAKTLQEISYPMCQQRMHGKQTFKNNSQSVTFIMPWKNELLSKPKNSKLTMTNPLSSTLLPFICTIGSHVQKTPHRDTYILFSL